MIVKDLVSETNRAVALGYTPVVVRMSEQTYECVVGEFAQPGADDPFPRQCKVNGLDVMFDNYLPWGQFRLLCEFDSAPEIDLEVR